MDAMFACLLKRYFNAMPSLKLIMIMYFFNYFTSIVFLGYISLSSMDSSSDSDTLRVAAKTRFVCECAYLYIYTHNVRNVFVAIQT